MSTLISILRFIHIFAAIFWVGTTLFMVFFLQPVVGSLGADGGKVMTRLSTGTRFSLVMSLAALATVLAGLFMFGAYTGGWDLSILLGSRLPLTLGAITGIAAAVVGMGVIGRTSGKVVDLGHKMATQDGPPAPEQTQEMQRLQRRIRQGTIWATVLMVIAVIGMTW